MSYWVLSENGTVVSRTAVSRVANNKAQTDKNKSKVTSLDKAVQERPNNKSHVIFEGVSVSRRIGVNILSFVTLVFRSSSAILSPMRRSKRLTMTSCHIYMTTPNSA